MEARIAPLSRIAHARTLHPGRLDIGPRLILGFAFIILAMLAADAVVLWQFGVVRTQAGRLNDIDQTLIAVLRVRTSLQEFHDRLNVLADSQNADRLVTQAGPLRAAVLEDIRRARRALGLLPFGFQRDPTVLLTLQVLQSALPSQLEAISTLASAGDWRAVRLRLANQIRPLESLTSAFVAKVEAEVGDERVQTVLDMQHAQRRVLLIVPVTAVFTLLIAGTLGLVITRSITQPLERLVEGSKALARGEFQHRVAISGDDELAHLGGVFNDTARRLEDLYATLQRSEDRLRLVIDTIPAHVWSARPDGSVDFINKRWLDSTGLPVESGLGWDWRSIVHPGDLAKYVDAWEAALADGKPMESEARLRRPDGEYRWWLIRNVPLRDERQNIVNWYGTAVDIEERHRAEDALRRSEASLHEAQRISHTGSWRHDLISGTITLSEEGARIWGVDSEEEASVAEFFFGRTHPDDASLVTRAYETARLTKRDFLSEFRIVLPDGTIKNIHAVGHPIPNEAGDIVEFVGAAMDITERKRAEEALRQAQADLAHVSRVITMGELTASLAHEVKQPIAAAVMNASTCLRWLAHDPPDVAEARAAALRIVDDGRRATDIIGRIRLLFMKGAPQREPVDVNELIQEMIVLLHSEATRCDVSVRTVLAGDLPQVMADRVQLQQVLMNLIVNGIDAMKAVDGPRDLTITSQRADGEQLLVSVSDTGVGLPPLGGDQIFKAFFTTKESGIGMGLSISRSIAESHGGSLLAANHSPRGASFRLTLPTGVGGPV
jgi:PAS domain S-box-containing protein